MCKFLVIVSFLIFYSPYTVWGQKIETKTLMHPSVQVERVGGIYKVSSIQRQASGTFTIQFDSKVKSERFDTLYLETDHIHIGIDEGQELRISAEVIAENTKRGFANIKQVLLYLPGKENPVPVWMMSKKYPNFQLKGNHDFLKMHLPQSDYIIL